MWSFGAGMHGSLTCCFVVFHVAQPWGRLWRVSNSLGLGPLSAMVEGGAGTSYVCTMVARRRSWF